MEQVVMYDTHKVVKGLINVGFSELQAEFFATQQKDMIDSNFATKADVAMIHKDIEGIRKDIETLRSDTKKDIEALRSDTKKDIEALRVEIKSDMKSMESRIINRMGVMMMSTVGSLAAFIAILQYIK